LDERSAGLIDRIRAAAASGGKRRCKPCGEKLLAATQAASSPRLQISAVLPARNEGGQVLATVESFRAAGAAEIVVVDDAGDDAIVLAKEFWPEETNGQENQKPD